MKGCMKFGCVGFIVIIFISIVASLFSDDDTPKKESYSSAYNTTGTLNAGLSPEQIREKERQDSIREANASYWHYRTKEDEMTSKKTYFAWIESENQAYFDFPYEGGSTLTLTLRQHPQWGKNVYIEISKGQFVSTYGGETIKVRFDDKPAKTFTLSEPADYDHTFRFVSGYSTFLSELKTAKVMKIQASFFEGGTRIFTFKVQNFNEDRYLNKPPKEGKKLTADGTLK